MKDCRRTQWVDEMVDLINGKIVVEGYADSLMDFNEDEGKRPNGVLFSARLWRTKDLETEKKYRITIEEINTATAGN